MRHIEAQWLRNHQDAAGHRILDFARLTRGFAHHEGNVHNASLPCRHI